MLSLFRIFDLSRIILVGIVLILIRLPFWIKGIPVIETNFEFRVLAEALANGRLMYADVWHYASPLSALVFQFVGELFGKSFIAFQIIAYLMVFVQAIIFNQVLNRNNAINEKTLIPAVIYIFLGSIFIEFYSLSPQLLVIFPIMGIYDVIMRQIRFGAEDSAFYQIGLLSALAVMFHAPSFWIIPFILIFLPFAFVMSGRRFGLYLSGLAFPFIGLVFYFYWRGALGELGQFYFTEIFKIFYQNYFETRQYVIFFSIPVIISVLGIFRTLFSIRFLNFQTSFNNFFLLMMLAVIPTVLFSKILSVRSFVLFLPVWTYFISQFYLSLRRRAINELIISLLLIFTVFVNYGFTYKTIFNPNVINIDKVLLKVSNDQKELKVLSTSNSYSAWFDNTYSGPFLFYPFTEDYFEQDLNYRERSELHAVIEKEKPDLILDDSQFLDEFMAQNYILSKRYSANANNYFRIIKD